MYVRVDGGRVVEWADTRPDGNVYDDVGAKWLRYPGWHEVTETVPPPVGASDVAEFGIDVVDGDLVQVWTVRVATDAELKRRDLSGEIATLRLWAAEADAVTVTATNAVQVLAAVTDRLGVFFARFADLLDVLDLDDSPSR